MEQLEGLRNGTPLEIQTKNVQSNLLHYFRLHNAQGAYITESKSTLFNWLNTAVTKSPKKNKASAKEAGSSAMIF